MKRIKLMTQLPLVTMLGCALPVTSIIAQDGATQETDQGAVFEAMGYAMASQLRLNIGFSENELDSLFAGMARAANGEDQPEGFQESVAQAQQIYMQRMQTFQMKEQELAQAVAAANKEKEDAFFESLVASGNVQSTESGLHYEILEEGDGPAPGENDRVKVNYRGVLMDGREFDANDGAEFMVSRVVPGFAEGLRLMKTGGKIKLYIPSALGYGNAPARPGSIIEPGSTLIFEVELLEVMAMPSPPTTPPPGLPRNMTPPPPPPSGPPPGPPPSTPPQVRPPAPS